MEINRSQGPAPMLFAAAFIAFAYFHQGGGWNQNGRFAMVRGIVEEGTLSIDSYLIYTRADAGGTLLRRVPVKNGEFAGGNQTNVLVWRDAEDRPFPVNGLAREPGNMRLVDLEAFCATGDVAFALGHFYPNKAPGTSFIAVPAYWIIYHFEKFIGANPDQWWTLTLNAWLTSVLSIGIISAIGVVLFYFLALALSGGRVMASLLCAIAFAFGTMFFPYATSLYEHNVIAAGLLASFYLLYQLKTLSAAATSKQINRRKFIAYSFLSGLCAGYAAITNYIIVVVVAILGCYTVFALRRTGAWFWFALGVLGPLVLICVYNQVCFGTPFTTNYRYQNPLFASTSKAFLDVFITPRTFNGSVLNYAKEVSSVFVMVLISPFRGLFFSAPVLLMGVFGIFELFRRKDFRAEAWLTISILLFFLLFISHYNGWHGGWANGPRYLVPALPFLAVPAVFGFIRFPKLSITLMVISVAIQLLATAVDPQSPIGVAGNAVAANLVIDQDPATGRERVRSAAKEQWKYNPLTEYVLPLFLSERAWPLLREQRDFFLGYQDLMMRRGGVSPERRESAWIAEGNRIDDSIRKGELTTLFIDPRTGNPGLSELPTIAGPVSANTIGMYEGKMHQLFVSHSTTARWNSFNLGEFAFAESRLSLLPLMLACGALLWSSMAIARKIERAWVNQG